MAKKLPTPEEYGRRLAERKRKASQMPDVLMKLDGMAKELAKYTGTLADLPLREVEISLEGLKSKVAELDQLREMTEVLKAIQELQDKIIVGMDFLAEGIKNLKFPVLPEPRDYGPEFEQVIREVKGSRSSGSQSPAVTLSSPSAYEFDRIVRDENGDIAAGTRVTPVTKH